MDTRVNRFAVPCDSNRAGTAAAAARNRIVVLTLSFMSRRQAKAIISRGVSAPHSYLIEVLSAVGKSLGTGMVTEPVAAHSVPR